MIDSHVRDTIPSPSPSPAACPQCGFNHTDEPSGFGMITCVACWHARYDSRIMMRWRDDVPPGFTWKATPMDGSSLAQAGKNNRLIWHLLKNGKELGYVRYDHNRHAYLAFITKHGNLMLINGQIFKTSREAAEELVMRCRLRSS